MLKLSFQVIGLVGVLIISYLAFTIPINPHEIIPAMSVMGFDKPLWLCIIVGCGVPYLIALWYVYDTLKQRKIA